MSAEKPQPYSQLAFKPTEPGNSAEPVSGTIVAIHGYRQEPDPITELAAEVAPTMRVEAPIAPRGVYQSIHIIGRTWFGESLERPEVAIFGDSLAQLEMFIHDAQNRAGADAPKPWLLGYDQGAVLVLTIALIAPDLISGVIAIEGGLPQFSDPELIQPVNGDLPILLIGDATGEDDSTVQEKTATSLKELGHRVETGSFSNAGTFPAELRKGIRDWLAGQFSL